MFVPFTNGRTEAQRGSASVQEPRRVPSLCQEGSLLLKWDDQGVLTDTATFKQRPEGAERRNCVEIYGKSLAGKGRGSAKALRCRIACLRKSQGGWSRGTKRESISEQPESKGHAENSASSCVRWKSVEVLSGGRSNTS